MEPIALKTAWPDTAHCTLSSLWVETHCFEVKFGVISLLDFVDESSQGCVLWRSVFVHLARHVPHGQAETPEPASPPHSEWCSTVWCSARNDNLWFSRFDLWGDLTILAQTILSGSICSSELHEIDDSHIFTEISWTPKQHKMSIPRPRAPPIWQATPPKGVSRGHLARKLSTNPSREGRMDNNNNNNNNKYYYHYSYH